MKKNLNKIGLVVLSATIVVAACRKHKIEAGGGIRLNLDNISMVADAVLQQAYYTDAAFTSETTGYAISNTGVIIKTTDGGQNWVALNSTVSYFLEEIVFTNPQTGYAIGGDALASWVLKTDNAGATWTAARLNTGGGRPTGIWFTDTAHGFITGPGFFLKTGNAGNTWTNALMVSVPGLFDVKFMNAATGYASAGDGAYYKTTDGGQNWQRRETGFEGDLGEICFAGPAVYFKSGNQLINAEPGKPVIVIPHAVHKLHFIDADAAIGIGQHYETGFWPYGDIFITNNKWASSSSRKYVPEQALSISAMARVADRKFIMIGTGLQKVSVIRLEY